jgi:hypothetical protein
MTRKRLLVLVVIILCFVVFVYSGLDHEKSYRMNKGPIASLGEKLNEYQGTIVKYKRMFGARYNEGHRDVILEKWKSFIHGLQKGNELIFTDPSGNTVTDPALIVDYFIKAQRIEFTLNEFLLKCFNLAKDAELYTIDCEAKVTVAVHFITEKNDTGKMVFTLRHMKVCEGD